LNAALDDLAGAATGMFYTASALWSDPEVMWDHLKAGLANWRQTMDLVLQQGIEVLQRWPNMTPADRADLLGRIAAQISETVPPEARDAGRFDEALREAVRLHLDKAARGLAIVERGGVPLTEEAAVELVKRLDRFGITGVDEAVAVADAIDDALPCSIVGLAPLARLAQAGSKPPCTVAQIASAFGQLAASAQRMGLTRDDELRDFLKSMAIRATPGAVVDNLLSLDDKAFAEEVVRAKGGVLVGPRAGSLQIIDGFYRGHPVQLTEVTSSDIASISAAVVGTQQSAAVTGYRQIDVYIRAAGFTRNQVLTYAQGGALTRTTQGGAIHAIDILTADGQWVHIEGGLAL
jgi:hypothetical protein